MYHVVRDDEPDVGSGKRDIHISRTRQIQKVIPAQEKSMSARLQAFSLKTES